MKDEVSVIDTGDIKLGAKICFLIILCTITGAVITKDSYTGTRLEETQLPEFAYLYRNNVDERPSHLEICSPEPCDTVVQYYPCYDPKTESLAVCFNSKLSPENEAFEYMVRLRELSHSCPDIY